MRGRIVAGIAFAVGLIIVSATIFGHIAPQWGPYLGGVALAALAGHYLFGKKPTPSATMVARDGMSTMRTLTRSLVLLVFLTLVAVAAIVAAELFDRFMFQRAPDGTLTMAGRCAKASWQRHSSDRLREKAECDRWKAAGQPVDWDSTPIQGKCITAFLHKDKGDRPREQAECDRWKAAGYPEDWK